MGRRIARIASLTIIPGALLWGAAPAAAGDPDPGLRASALERLDRLRTDGEMSYARGSARTRAPLRDGENPIDVVHTDVTLDADETAGTIDADVAVTIRALAEGVAEAEFTVQPLAAFSVEDGDGVALTYTYNPAWGMVTVTLPAPLALGAEQELVFHTAGEPDCSPDDYFGMVFCQYASADIVFDAGPMWIPSRTAYTYEDLNTSGGVDMHILTPPGMTAVTTSDPAGVDDLGDGLVHHFAGNFPSSYLGFAYAPFETFADETAAGEPVAAYLHTGTTAFGQAWATAGADMVDFFGEVFTPYLYNKADVIQTIDALGGGVGPASATFYYASALCTDPATPFSESIFSHEIGHSWWANMIRSADMYSPWLSEGFAEYSSRLYGYEVWPAYYQDYLYESYFTYFRSYVTEETEVPLTGEGIFTADSTVYFIITYLKGAHVLRTLQWLVGDEAFFAAISAYAASHVWSPESPATVTVDAFREAMEGASGADLAGFFEQWVYGTGHPIYSWAAEFGGDVESGYTARVRVEQIQDDGAPFDVPLEVSVWVGDEQEPRRFRVGFDGAVADATFDLEAEPRALKIDDRWWIWGDRIPELVGDLDGSNEVDGIDLVYMAWSQGGDYDDTTGATYYLHEADLDRDWDVDGDDLAALLAAFGDKGAIDE